MGRVWEGHLEMDLGWGGDIQALDLLNIMGNSRFALILYMQVLPTASTWMRLFTSTRKFFGARAIAKIAGNTCWQPKQNVDSPRVHRKLWHVTHYETIPLKV